LSRILSFPQRLRAISQPNAASTTTLQLNRSRRLHLYDPAVEEVRHRALDLAQQIGVTMSHIEREIELSIARDRNQRLLVGQRCDA
jgi:hypothetical protein